jgi:hypothetical protein
MPVRRMTRGGGYALRWQLEDKKYNEREISHFFRPGTVLEIST